jgi:hypothetical protein
MHSTEQTVAGLPVEPAARSRLWLWVGAVFALQLAVWVAWLIFAAHHPVAEVPLSPETVRHAAN